MRRGSTETVAELFLGLGEGVKRKHVRWICTDIYSRTRYSGDVRAEMHWKKICQLGMSLTSLFSALMQGKSDGAIVAIVYHISRFCIIEHSKAGSDAIFSVFITYVQTAAAPYRTRSRFLKLEQALQGNLMLLTQRSPHCCGPSCQKIRCR